MCDCRSIRHRLRARLSVVLAVAAASTGLAGCESAVSPAPGAAANTAWPAGSSEHAAAAKGAGSSLGQSLAGTGQEKSGQSKIVSTIEGDRLSVIPTTIVLSKQTESSPFRFAEIAKEAGIDFVHFSGMTTDKYFPTANGSGVAVFDFDNDGLLDLYFATATLLPLGTAVKGPNRLYKNMGNNHFKDATETSGLGFRGFCHGIITGDIDNDGDQDVLLCNYGPNVLYVNNGNGTFTDISQQAGIIAICKEAIYEEVSQLTNLDEKAKAAKIEAYQNWSSGGAMLDYDNDGYLDIYVSNYGRWTSHEDHHLVGDVKRGVYLYSSPRSIRTTKHLFLHNNRNLTFTNVYDKVITVEKEVEDPKTNTKKTVRVPEPRSDGHGFGVVTADLNNDGLIDIYVANDMNPNFLFLNQGDGTFDDASEISGAAYDVNGMAQSGMGVDAEDVDGDGLPELFVTNFTNEYSTLYLNYGKGVFYDSTAFFGLASDSMPWVKWGCALADFDNDGWPDCFFANGHVDNNRRQLEPPQPIDYEEIPLLFRNDHGKRFRLSTRDVGTYFDTKHVARGAAFGDLDNDGDMDIVVNHKDAAPAVLRNDTKTSNHWIRFSLQGTRSNRDAIGTKLEIDIGERVIYRQRKGGYSMQGTNDPRVLIGIGAATQVKKVTFRWPSGIVSTLEDLKANQEYKVVEPKDEVPQPRSKATDKSSQGPAK
jgi:enediyne biosynthesis protein E4